MHRSAEVGSFDSGESLVAIECLWTLGRKAQFPVAATDSSFGHIATSTISMKHGSNADHPP